MAMKQPLLKIKIRNSKKYYFTNIKPMFLKLWIITNFNTGFPVVVLVFDFDEFSVGVLLGHSVIIFVT
jgi:hypothetical protein